MPVKSYIVLAIPGGRNELIDSLKKFPYCEAFPAENEEVIVLVTDTNNEEDENTLIESLNSLPSLKHLSLVSGFKSNAI